MTMTKATELLTKEEAQSVEAAITEAEKKTSAEIVPVVVSSSGRYDRAEDLFAFLLALVVLSLCWTMSGGETEGWSLVEPSTLSLPGILVTLFITFLIGVALATRIPALRRPLITKREMQEEVERSARETFQRLNLRRTEKATGILIYASLYERMVHVEGDDTISAQLNQSDWEEICQKIVDGFKNGKPEQGLREGIEKSGELLGKYFPADANIPNELFDTLHLIDR